MTRNRTRIGSPVASTVIGLALMFTVACATEGRPGARSGDDAKLSSEQRANLERYQKLVHVAEQRTRAREFKKALKALSDAEILAGRVYGPDRAIFAKTKARLGRVYTAMGRFDLATQAYLKELALWKKALYPGDNIVLARCLQRIGRTYFFAGKLKEAADYLKRAVAMRRKTLRKVPRRLGKHYVDQTDRSRDVELAEALHELGLVYWRQKQYDEAAAVIKEAADIRRKHLRVGHLDLLQSLLSLAQLNEIRGRRVVAEKLYLELVNRVGKRRRPASSVLGSALKQLADLYRRMKRYPQAERYYNQARKVAKEAKQFGRRDIYLAQIDAGLAMVYARSKRPKEAEKLFKRALKVFAQYPKVLANHAVRCHIQLARMYRANKDLKQAQSQVRAALNLASQHLGPRSYAYARSLAELAEVYVAQKAREHAAKLLRQAFDLTRQAFGADHPRAQRMRKKLVALYRALGWKKKIQDLPK